MLPVMLSCSLYNTGRTCLFAALLMSSSEAWPGFKSVKQHDQDKAVTEQVVMKSTCRASATVVR